MPYAPLDGPAEPLNGYTPPPSSPDPSMPAAPTSSPSAPSAPAAAAAAPPPAPSLATQTAGIGMYDLAVLMTLGGGAPVNGPNRYLAPDEIAEISPIPSNTANINISGNTPDDAKFGPRRIVLTPTALPRPVTLRSLNELWIYSTVTGEGVIIEIRKRAR